MVTRIIFLLALFVTVPVSAQQQRIFNLQVSEADIVIIGRALEAMSYREAAPVIARLQVQITEQTKDTK
jgi:hypothetical protein